RTSSPRQIRPANGISSCSIPFCERRMQRSIIILSMIVRWLSEPFVFAIIFHYPVTNKYFQGLLRDDDASTTSRRLAQSEHRSMFPTDFWQACVQARPEPTLAPKQRAPARKAPYNFRARRTPLCPIHQHLPAPQNNRLATKFQYPQSWIWNTGTSRDFSHFSGVLKAHHQL